MLQNHSIFLKISILFSLIVIISVGTYYSNIKYFSKNKNIENTLKVINRNNILLYEIALKAEQIYEKKGKSKSEIANAVFLYDFSLSIIKNGGVPSGFKKKFLVPVPDDETRNYIKDIEKQWYKFKANADKLTNDKLYVFEKKPKDTLINNEFVEIIITERVKNKMIIVAKKSIRSNLQVLINLNNNLKMRLLEDKESNNSIARVIIVFSIISYILILGFSLFIFKTNVIKSINKINLALKSITTGENLKISEIKHAEFKNINKSINDVISKFTNISEFVKNLQNNNFDAEFKDYSKDSIIDTELLNLRDKLYNSDEFEKERLESDKYKRWAAEGQNKFNEILRNSSAGLKALSDSVILNLVKFLEASQGGLFTINNKDVNNKFIELTSAFAYDRKKYFEKTIQLGEGLIGTCALEKNIIWIDDVPRDYMNIESGLGEARPQSVLIVPLKTETELMGIIEIASFNKFQKYEVDFVEDIANNIASSLEATKISDRTTELLLESQKKSEELAIGEAEMKVKIKELSKAQLEARKKELEIETLLSAVDNALYKAEISKRGKFTSANRLLLNRLDYHIGDFLNISFNELVPPEYVAEVDKALKNAFNGETVKLLITILTKYNKPVWLQAQVSPVKDEGGKIRSILFLGNDISKQKEIEENNKKLLKETIEKAEKLAEKDLIMTANYENLTKSQTEIEEKGFEVKTLLTAININLMMAEFDINGFAIHVNEKFENTLLYTKDEIINKNIRSIIQKEYLTELENIWKKLLEGESYSEVIKQETKKGEMLWLLVSFTPLRDKNNKIIKVVFLANDITKQKEQEQEILKQTEMLEEQELSMIENMEEMLEAQDLLQAEVDKFSEQLSKITDKLENETDQKYYDWLNKIKNDLS